MKKTIILLAMITTTAVMAQKETVVDGVAAVVGRNIIKYSDIERSYAQVRMQHGVGNAEKERCAILENLILNQLLVHKGEVDSIEVSDDEVAKYAEYYLKADMRQYGTREAMRAAKGMTYDEIKQQYMHQLHDLILAQRTQAKLTNNIGVTPNEVNEFFKNMPADSLPVIEDRYELSEIVIEPEISEAERDRVRTQLAELRERVLKGEKFTMLATLYSQDPVSAKKGGELGFFGRGEMVGDFESVAFALKPGDVSPIVETQFGFHIIQLIERRGNTVNCRHILITPKVSTEDLLQARMKLDSLATEIKAGKINFADAARQYSTAPNGKSGGKAVNPADDTPRFDKQAIDQGYFNVGVGGMKEGDVSSALPTKTDNNKDAYRLVRLDKKYPAHKANLTDDYDAIYNAALASVRQKALAKWAKRQAAITFIKLSDEYKDCNFENLGINTKK